MSLKDTIDLLKNTLQPVISNALATASIEDFDDYLANTPTQSEKKQLAFYFDNKQNDGTNKIFNFIVQAQLHGVLARDSWDYQDIIESAILGIDVESLGYESMDRLNIETYPIFENDSTIILFELSFSISVDDCNFDK